MAGVIQIIVGVFKWAKYIRLVPESVMYGFVNGLAVIIFSAQLGQFYVKGEGGKDILDEMGQTMLLQGSEMYIMAGLVALTVVTTFVFPKITKKFPASLFAIILVFGIVLAFGIDTRTVGDISPVSGSLPPFHIPMVPLTWETFVTILPYGAVVAAVGLTEGLLTLNLVDEITETKGNGSREALAQGASNILNGFFTGMGGCPMIAQTLVNLEAGARTRIAGTVGAIAILIIILVAAPVIELIPMAALTGVMMVVAFFTFKWSSFKILTKMPAVDVVVMLIVTAITIIWHNLAVAVLVGILISAMSFAWKKANSISSNQIIEGGVKTYELHGSLFFGAVTAFEEMFDIKNDPNSIILDFKHSTISDMSAIETLNKVSNKYKALGKEVKVINLNDTSIKTLKRAANLVEVKY